jgi:hypothetical protein
MGVNKELMALIISDTRAMSDTELRRVRETGEGDGFSVLDPKDGFRHDDTLWFGRCSVCGEVVSNSWREGFWTHTVYTNKTYHTSGMIASSTSHQTTYCPTERGEA